MSSDLDDTPLAFGKYKGKTPDEVSELNPGYLIWMYKEFDNPPMSKAMYEYCCSVKNKEIKLKEELDNEFL